MIEKIEAKIEAHVKSILKKDAIDYADYQVLIGEISRLKSKEQAEKWDNEKEERNAAMTQMLQTLYKM